MDISSELIREQIQYYRARSGEYDEWFLRQGRYDHGPEANAEWFKEVGEVAEALARFNPERRVLELAAGTGWWTEQLLRTAASITAVDSSPEVLALNRSRVRGSDRVEYVQADLFTWQPTERYDVVFFSFWLSHVPPDQFDAFWDLVRASLAPGGRVFFIDSLSSQQGTAVDQRLDPASVIMQRRLNDGREFQVVKVYYSPAELAARLTDLGWDVTVHTTEHYFLYGYGSSR